MHGIDRRTRRSRRFEALVAEITQELGGNLSLTERLAVERAATHTLEIEEIRAAIIRGEPADSDKLVRASNAAARAMSDLRKGRAVKAKAGSRGALADFMASRGAQRA